MIKPNDIEGIYNNLSEITAITKVNGDTSFYTVLWKILKIEEVWVLLNDDIIQRDLEYEFLKQLLDL